DALPISGLPARRLRARERGAGPAAGAAQPGRRPRPQPLLLRRRATAGAAVLDQPVRLVPRVLPPAAAAWGQAVPEAPAGAGRLRRRRLPFDVRLGRRTGPPEPGATPAVHFEAPPRSLGGGGGPAPLRSAREAEAPPPASSQL